MLLQQRQEHSGHPLHRQTSRAALGHLPPGRAAARIKVTTWSAESAGGRAAAWQKSSLLLSGKRLWSRIHLRAPGKAAEGPQVQTHPTTFRRIKSMRSSVPSVPMQSCTPRPLPPVRHQPYKTPGHAGPGGGESSGAPRHWSHRCRRRRGTWGPTARLHPTGRLLELMQFRHANRYPGFCFGS